MESRKKQNETISRRSLALLPTPPGKGFPSSAVFFTAPDSLTDKAFGLEARRITAGSTPVQGIMKKQLVAKQVNVRRADKRRCFFCNNNFFGRTVK